MTTMVENPCVCHVPTLTDGIGYNGVYNLHKSHFSGKMPKDMKITYVSVCELKNAHLNISHLPQEIVESFALYMRISLFGITG